MILDHGNILFKLVQSCWLNSCCLSSGGVQSLESAVSVVDVVSVCDMCVVAKLVAMAEKSGALLGLLLLGLEGLDVSVDQDVQLGLELRAVAKEEQDLVDNKVGGKDKSYINKETPRGQFVTRSSRVPFSSPSYCSVFFVTLQQVVHQLWGTLLKDSVANELGNPGNDMDTQRNLLGLRVGFEEVSGVLGKSEEDGCSKELYVTEYTR